MEETKVKITRRGMKKNTQWMIIPLGPVDAKGLKTIASVHLNVLNGQATTPPQENSSQEDDGSEPLPF